ncbi:hypothetical protein SAMN04489806_0861 [Paramicrobacterium humi]|uniref:Uncharacterized protein n=1 Tax=Paramicrobacterium humi TaxID=640635 RepID=A0A1H4JUN2_9MICO|nr:DUF6412 domain-containing protein [Microbacterium humi]SEB49706.1 hypothetical protein SAMN04489806_0861 [Microbacterium humi]
MLQYLEILTRFLTAAFELSASQHTLWQFALLAAIGLAGGAVLVYARTSLVLAALVFGARPPERIVPPRDIARLLSQSAPDAAGKPQPRAPGAGVPAVA